MNNTQSDDIESAEIDAMLRDLFRGSAEPHIARNLAARAIELSNVPQTDVARWMRRSVRAMNVLGFFLLAVMLWTGAQNLSATFDSTTATTDTTESATSTTTTGLEIAGAALLLFAAAGTQWAFRAPAEQPYHLSIMPA